MGKPTEGSSARGEGGRDARSWVVLRLEAVRTGDEGGLHRKLKAAGAWGTAERAILARLLEFCVGSLRGYGGGIGSSRL